MDSCASRILIFLLAAASVASLAAEGDPPPASAVQPKEEATQTSPTVSVDPQQILLQTDRSRGGGTQGIEWTVRLMSTTGKGDTEERVMLVKATTDSSLAETLEPVRFKGSKLLQVHNNMWLGRPGLRKPIPISPRQKLMGQAANGDIAATNYVADYDATLEREDVFEDEPVYVLNLKAKSKYSTYDRIVYWISKERALGVKAEFFSLSAKLLKTASFQYDNHVNFGGQSVPFVSRMTITDALSDLTTVLDYSAIRQSAVSPGEFEVTRLNQ